ncbi:hypothetical protein ACFL6I_12180 [candidate division KSB1 bacterium]
MKKIIPVLIIFLAIIYSCSKKKECDNAQLCFKNIGTDTILYCWGCNYYEDTLFPGAKVCTDVGEISISASGGSTSVVYFDSDHGSYAIKVTDCYIEKEIQ